MITIIFFALLGIAVAVFIHRREQKTFMGTGELVVLMIAGFAIGGAIGGLASTFIGQNLPTEPSRITNHNIIALQDGPNVHGSFFLGTGSLGGNLQYYFYTKDGKAIQGHSISASDVYLYQEKGQPYLQIQSGCQFVDKNLRLLFICNPHIDTFITVPPGTILEQYKMDLQ